MRKFHTIFFATLISLTLIVVFSDSVLAGWNQLPLYGGYVTQLRQTDDGALWAGTNLNGLFRSEDGGETWTHATLPASGITDFWFEGDGELLAVTPYRAFHSSNNGDDWTRLTTSGTWNFSLVYAAGGAYYIGGQRQGGSALERSTDLQDWSFTIELGPMARFNQMTENSSGHLFVATTEALYRSTDNGENWDRVYEGRVMGVCIDANDVVYLSHDRDGVMRSANNGADWEEVGPTGRSGGVMTAGSDGAIYCVRAQSLFKSEDGGENWVSDTPPISGAFSIKGLLADAANGDLFVSAPTGVIKSTEFGNWTTFSEGITGVRAWSAEFLSSGEIALGAGIPGGPGSNRVFRTSNLGVDWAENQTPESGMNGDIFDMKESADGVIMVTTSSYFYRSTDGGSGFDQVETPVHPNTRALLVHPNGDVFMGIIGTPVARSTDNGASFELCGEGPVSTNGLTINADGEMFAAGNGVFRSSNLGESWDELIEGFGAYRNALTCITCEPASGTLFAGVVGGGVFRSTDNGAHWAATNTGMPRGEGVQYLTINALAVNSVGHVFAATAFTTEDDEIECGVYLTHNLGESWSNIAEDVPYRVRDLAFDNNGRLLLGTDVGAFLSDESWNSVGSEAKPTTPVNYGLISPFPNPFNSTTTIGYSLPAAGNVRVAVYDLSGREVARLADGMMNAGTHEAVWQADGMASGVYVVKLDAGGVVAREKVVLVR